MASIFVFDPTSQVREGLGGYLREKGGYFKGVSEPELRKREKKSFLRCNIFTLYFK